MDEKKLKAIREFPKPKTIKQVQSFVGTCAYYRRSIKNFSQIAAPLTGLTKGVKRFEWEERQEKAFQELKMRLVKAKIVFSPDLIPVWEPSYGRMHPELVLLLCSRRITKTHPVDMW